MIRNRMSVVGRAVVVSVMVLAVLAGQAVAQASVPMVAEQPQVDWIDILQNVITLLITVALPPLIAWAITELKRFIDQIRDEARWRHIYWAVSNAVQAAEQLGLTEQLSKFGESKLDAALSFVQAELAAAGVPLDVHEHAFLIRGLIEAEVLRQFPPVETGDGAGMPLEALAA